MARPVYIGQTRISEGSLDSRVRLIHSDSDKGFESVWSVYPSRSYQIDGGI
jgi:hypothetical protein